MPFCPSCGKETVTGAVYCTNCGKPLQISTQPHFYSQTLYYQRKEPAIAAILSLLIAGVGQMYVGRIIRGIVILLLPTVAAIFIIPGLFFQAFLLSFSEIMPPFPGSGQPIIPFSFATFFAAFVLITLIGIAYHVWNIFDAYNLAKTYNQQLETTGRAPW